MRDIEGIEHVLKSLKPHWGMIEGHFEKENKQFKSLMNRDHDSLGRVLKCHLIVEHFLDRFLEKKYGLETLQDARLTFIQKAKLLPDAGSHVSFVKPGIIKLNRIRNQLGHELQARLDIGDLESINQVLKVARPNAIFSDVIERIEAFIAVVCAWLIVLPPALAPLFEEAFSKIQVSPDVEAELG